MISRAWEIAHAGEALTPEQEQRAAEIAAKRQTGEPLAYIVGTAEFYGREFAVDRNVLVPRPETELLVEEAIAFLRERTDVIAPRVFEAGVGSGAIACTIAAEVPNARVHGTDISADALRVARANAARLGVAERCTFERADIIPTRPARYDVVIANLPYVKSGEIAGLPIECSFEPRVALDGGPDGLQEYRKLLAAVSRLLAEDGLLLLEAAPPTIPALAELTRTALPVAGVEIRRDYAGLDRYVRAQG